MEESVVKKVSELGEALRSGRKAQGLTQEQFAMIADVGTRFISELERGKESAELGLSLRVIDLAGYEVVLRPKDWSSIGRGESN